MHSVVNILHIVGGGDNILTDIDFSIHWSLQEESNLILRSLWWWRCRSYEIVKRIEMRVLQFHGPNAKVLGYPGNLGSVAGKSRYMYRRQANLGRCQRQIGLREPC